MHKFYSAAVMLLCAITFTTARAQADDAAAKADAVDLLTQRLSAQYIFADAGNKMAAAVRDHWRNGDYAKATTDAEFAELLTTHIQAANPDKDLIIRYVPNARPDRPRPSVKQAMPADIKERITAAGQYLNFSFDKVERLPGNIMYVKFDSFFDADIARATATSAMNLAAHGNAMIIDLRENGGGDPRPCAGPASSAAKNHQPRRTVQP